MSHNIYMPVYDERVNKKAVQKYWDQTAAHDDWQEGCTGLCRDIRWIDHICANEEEAKEYIETHDKGGYDQLAVKFKSIPKEELKSSTLERLQKQIKSYEEKIVEYDKKHGVDTLKAEFITCPQCKSKLSKEWLVKRGHNHRCPICGQQDIRAAYIAETLEGYKAKIREWQKQVKAEEKKLAEKLDKKAKIKWLVKIEYHT